MAVRPGEERKDIQTIHRGPRLGGTPEPASPTLQSTTNSKYGGDQHRPPRLDSLRGPPRGPRSHNRRQCKRRRRHRGSRVSPSRHHRGHTRHKTGRKHRRSRSHPLLYNMLPHPLQDPTCNKQSRHGSKSKSGGQRHSGTRPPYADRQQHPRSRDPEHRPSHQPGQAQEARGGTAPDSKPTGPASTDRGCTSPTSRSCVLARIGDAPDRAADVPFETGWPCTEATGDGICIC